MNKILIIEDEKNLAESLEIILSEEGFEVEVLNSGHGFLDKYKNFDLMVLDLTLPDMSGFDILQSIRLADSGFPVIILSAKSEEEDIVKGLTLGADDYITKPFSVKELVLRIKRTLQRKLLYKSPDDNEVKIGENFSINFSTLTANTSEGVKQLTTQEVIVLGYLIKNEGRTVTRQELLEKTWGYKSNIETRTVDNFIVRFRKYFEKDPKNPVHFITNRGAGYSYLK